MTATNRSKTRFATMAAFITVLVAASVLLLYVAGCGSSSESADNENDPVVNDDVVTATCPYTNDGECDEPEGLNVCPEGSDVVDCANVEEEEEDVSNCGEPCPNGCCSLSGAICCKPPFCSGNCIGSPCC